MATTLQQVKPVRLPTAVKATPYVAPHRPAAPPRQVTRPTASPHKAKKPKPAPHEFPQYDAPRSMAYAASPLIKPAELFKILEVAPYARIDFASERALQNFRVNLYKVNVEGKFRYATRREGWSSLIVLRLK